MFANNGAGAKAPALTGIITKRNIPVTAWGIEEARSFLQHLNNAFFFISASMSIGIVFEGYGKIIWRFLNHGRDIRRSTIKFDVSLDIQYEERDPQIRILLKILNAGNRNWNCGDGVSVRNDFTKSKHGTAFLRNYGFHIPKKLGKGQEITIGEFCKSPLLRVYQDDAARIIKKAVRLYLMLYKKV